MRALSIRLSLSRKGEDEGEGCWCMREIRRRTLAYPFHSEGKGE
jgi:hypothetical protein